jgi:small subunit ribosomal protein S9
MAEKKAEKVEKTEKAPKIEKEKKPAKTVKKTTEKYFYAVGRRKTSVAQVRVYENDKATDADLLVNGKTLKEYFPALSLQNNILAPFKTAGLGGKVKMTVIVRGGGFNGQADAVRLGISRALVLMNAEFKK